MPDSNTQKNAQGFTLIELMLVVAVIVILAAATVPRLMNVVNDINLRYAASDLSGLLQTARMQAVRRNTFYTVPSAVLGGGQTSYYIDIPKAGIYVAGDPVLPLNPS